MRKSILTKYRLFPLLLVAAFLLYACGAQTTPASTVTPAPTATPTSTPKPTKEPKVGTDIKVELPEGDTQSGFTDAIRFRCYGCHADPKYASYGPRFESSVEMPVILERGDLRIAYPEYEGRASTNREYIIESILLPEAYLVEGAWEEPMPTYFGDIIEDQDLADIIAWMATLE